MQIVLKLLVSMGMKLLTETLIKNFLIIILESLVKQTENKLDDKLVQEVKKALEK